MTIDLSKPDWEKLHKMMVGFVEHASELDGMLFNAMKRRLLELESEAEAKDERIEELEAADSQTTNVCADAIVEANHRARCLKYELVMCRRDGKQLFEALRMSRILDTQPSVFELRIVHSDENYESFRRLAGETP